MIRLPADIRQRILAAAEAAYPEECCGLLAGRPLPDGTVAVTRLADSANVADGDRRRSFEVDPKVRFDLMRELESAGGDETVVGHVHSHPDHPPEPSATDLAMAYEPEFVWLIVGVADGRAGPLRGFRRNAAGDGFDELEIAVE